MANDVEKYLREKGEFGQPRVTTDWLGRAVQGMGPNKSGWHMHYYARWLRDHPDAPEGPQQRYGVWCPDSRGRQWWVTETPEWDRDWFRSVGVRPPKRITDRARTYWKDYGGGLSGMAIR